MSFVSEKSKKTPRSVIREMFAMQTGMKDVVSFALGEPDFTAPKHVIEATVASFNRGETHYVANAGIPALRTAVAEHRTKRGYPCGTANVLIGSGAISVLCLAATAILDIGDEVIVSDPGWANYRGLITQVGAVAVPVKVREENGFMFDIDDLRRAVTPKTKVILINSPANPTGGVESAENLKRIAELAIEKDLYIISDEIYNALLWDDEPYASIVSIPGMAERTIVIDGFSKKFAMTGFRLGYGVGPEELIAAMTKLLENVLSSVNEGIQWGGVAALTGDQGCVDAMIAEYRKRRRLIVDGLNSIDRISCLEPKGAFYAFPNISRTGMKSRDFAIKLLQDEHVVVVPGTGFGDGGEGFVRLSYATSEENIREGLVRLKRFVEKLP